MPIGAMEPITMTGKPQTPEEPIGILTISVAKPRGGRVESSDWRQRAATCFTMADQADDPWLKTLLLSLGDEMLEAAEEQELFAESTSRPFLNRSQQRRR